MFVLIFAMLIIGLICVRVGTKAADQLAVQTQEVTRQRDQLLADLDQVRQRRHTQPTIEMLEDLEAVAGDIKLEMKEFIVYITSRIKKMDQIFAAGRPGPYSYKPLDTRDRARRPGSAVKLWS